ncbi:uncharacterized [Tachysurus ichikawai]
MSGTQAQCPHNLLNIPSNSFHPHYNQNPQWPIITNTPCIPIIHNSNVSPMLLTSLVPPVFPIPLKSLVFPASGVHLYHLVFQVSYHSQQSHVPKDPTIPSEPLVPQHPNNTSFLSDHLKYDKG